VDLMSETCKNPFRKRRCDNTDIELYIIDSRIPICHNCWKKISGSDIEWNSEDTIETLLKKHSHYYNHNKPKGDKKS